MSSRLQQRRTRLQAEYGFDFPDDFRRFWEFVSRLSPLDPLNALAEVAGVVLVGPFEVLSGRFDGRVPRYSLLLHWRYHDDPPEFFTVLAGDTDGLHWGYYLDDPGEPGCVASYYARDAFELSTDGDSLFEALRLHLEYRYRDNEEYRAEDEENTAAYDEELRKLDELRRRLMRYETADRPETGEEYTTLYAGISRRESAVVAATREGMGIVMPEDLYRPLSLDDNKLWRTVRRSEEPESLIAEAWQALRDGFPGTALKLGKDLWAVGGEARSALAMELMDAAYQALERPILRRVLATHRANRALPTVDILEAEGEE